MAISAAIEPTDGAPASRGRHPRRRVRHAARLAVATTLLLSSGCGAVSGFKLRSGATVRGEVRGGNGHWINIEESSGQRIHLNKCAVTEVSHAGRPAIVWGSLVVAAAAAGVGYTAYSQWEQDAERDDALAAGRTYHDDSGPETSDYAYIAAVPVALVGAFLIFTGIEQREESQERIGALTCTSEEKNVPDYRLGGRQRGPTK